MIGQGYLCAEIQFNNHGVFIDKSQIIKQENKLKKLA